MRTKSLVIVALLALIVSTTHGATIYVDITNCLESTCCIPTGDPGCDIPGCETTVCDLVPLCCDIWDEFCVQLAESVCGGLCSPGPGDGSELDPYCSIQTAIDAAVDTDEIVVAPGTYFEAINFIGKAVWLHSSDGRDVTTIDGTGNSHVVQCVSKEGSDTVLDGFTITGGNANGGGFGCCGGGMYNE